MPSAPAKRRGPKSHGASRSTPASARLEKKLDDLMSLMRLQQAPVHLPNVSPQLQEAGHDDDDGNETSPTLTNNTPTAFQPDIYADEPSLEEAEATFRRFRDEMVVSHFRIICFIILLNLFMSPALMSLRLHPEWMGCNNAPSTIPISLVEHHECSLSLYQNPIFPWSPSQKYYSTKDSG